MTFNGRRKATPATAQSPLWMLNAGFGRAEKQTPLCYCCADAHKERPGGVVAGRDMESNGNLRIVYSEGAKKNWKNEAHGT